MKREDLIRQLFGNRTLSSEAAAEKAAREQQIADVYRRKAEFKKNLADLIRRCQCCNAKSSHQVIKPTSVGDLRLACAKESGVLEEFMEESFKPVKLPTEKPKSFGEWS